MPGFLSPKSKCSLLGGCEGGLPDANCIQITAALCVKPEKNASSCCSDTAHTGSLTSHCSCWKKLVAVMKLIGIGSFAFCYFLGLRRAVLTVAIWFRSISFTASSPCQKQKINEQWEFSLALFLCPFPPDRFLRSWGRHRPGEQMWWEFLLPSEIKLKLKIEMEIYSMIRFFNDWGLCSFSIGFCLWAARWSFGIWCLHFQSGFPQP